MPDTYSQIYLHYVFTVKYRRSLIALTFEKELYKYITGIVKNQNQLLIAINGMPDHVHMLVRLRPAMAPSKLIQLVKQNSSKWINQKGFLPHHFNWQVGGGIFSIGHIHVHHLVDYIANQKEHHKKKSFKEEYLELLEQHSIDFKGEYLLEFFEDLF